MVGRLLKPDQVMEIESISRSEFYRRRAAGEYEVVRDGAFGKVTEDSVLARRARLERIVRPRIGLKQQSKAPDVASVEGRN
jgi:hypothetical protein